MKFYVYLLCYPDGTPFYVGKGSGNRINDHEQDARRGRIGAKYDAIRAIWQSGGQVVKRIIFETSDEQQALDHEQHLIAHYGIANLTNYQPGGRPRAPKTHRFRDDTQQRIKRHGIKISNLAAVADIDYIHLTRQIRNCGVLRAATAHCVAGAFAHAIGVDHDTAFALLFED